MASPEQYKQRIAEALGAKWKGNSLQFKVSWKSHAEAQVLLGNIRQMQKSLQLIKQELALEVKAIRSASASQVATATPGVLAKMTGKGKARDSRADKRKRIVEKRDQALAPYEMLRVKVTDLLTQLDGIKLELQQELAKKNKE